MFKDTLTSGTRGQLLIGRLAATRGRVEFYDGCFSPKVNFSSDGGLGMSGNDSGHKSSFQNHPEVSNLGIR